MRLIKLYRHFLARKLCSWCCVSFTVMTDPHSKSKKMVVQVNKYILIHPACACVTELTNKLYPLICSHYSQESVIWGTHNDVLVGEGSHRGYRCRPPAAVKSRRWLPSKKVKTSVLVRAWLPRRDSSGLACLLLFSSLFFLLSALKRQQSLKSRPPHPPFLLHRGKCCPVNWTWPHTYFGILQGCLCVSMLPKVMLGTHDVDFSAWKDSLWPAKFVHKEDPEPKVPSLSSVDQR